MSEVIEGKGSCLCGAVGVTSRKLVKNVGACHCSMCRKWGGGPFLGVDCGQDVQFEGEENISAYSSSDWAERGFCKQCGTHLFYHLKQTGQYIMPVGLFENTDDFDFDHQIFIDEKPSFYSFSNKTENMTGEEAFAKFASQSE